MKTSDFFIKGSDPEAVSISRRCPSWYEGRHYEPLAPPGDLVDRYVDGLIDATQYEKEYRSRVLGQLDPVQVFKDLGPNAILLCNAPPGKFCHRRVAADWLESTLGIEVTEWSDGQIVK
jgi:hypothetical protein